MHFWKLLLKGEFLSITVFLGKIWPQATNSNNFGNLRGNEVGEGKKIVLCFFCNSELKSNEL